VSAIRPPVVAGYLALPAHTNALAAEELAGEWRALFAAHARRHGYLLGSVFTDVRDRGEGGLYLLAEYLRHAEVVAVMVPDLGHLTHARCLAGADRRTVQRYLRAAVLPVAAERSDGAHGRR
jgi:hypothetical protein